MKDQQLATDASVRAGAVLWMDENGVWGMSEGPPPSPQTNQPRVQALFIIYWDPGKDTFPSKGEDHLYTKGDMKLGKERWRENSLALGRAMGQGRARHSLAHCGAESVTN